MILIQKTPAMSNLHEIRLLTKNLRALDRKNDLFRPLLSVYFIRKIVDICAPPRPDYEYLKAFMRNFRTEFRASFLIPTRLDVSPFHPDKCSVIKQKCDFATRLFKRADEVLNFDLNILALKQDVAKFDHDEHAELRKELVKGSSAQGSSTQGSSTQGSSAQGSSAQGSSAQGSSQGSSERKRQRDDTRKGLELLRAKIRGIKSRRERCTNEKIALSKKIDLLNEEIAECDKELDDLTPINID